MLSAPKTIRIIVLYTMYTSLCSKRGELISVARMVWACREDAVRRHATRQPVYVLNGGTACDIRTYIFKSMVYILLDLMMCPSAWWTHTIIDTDVRKFFESHLQHHHQLAVISYFLRATTAQTSWSEIQRSWTNRFKIEFDYTVCMIGKVPVDGIVAPYDSGMNIYRSPNTILQR